MLDVGQDCRHRVWDHGNGQARVQCVRGWISLNSAVRGMYSCHLTVKANSSAQGTELLHDAGAHREIACANSFAALRGLPGTPYDAQVIPSPTSPTM